LKTLKAETLEVYLIVLDESYIKAKIVKIKLLHLHVKISVDFNKVAWLDAIKKDKLEMWHHIPVAEKYA